jgi:hypothetical protein
MTEQVALVHEYANIAQVLCGTSALLFGIHSLRAVMVAWIMRKCPEVTLVGPEGSGAIFERRNDNA